MSVPNYSCPPQQNSGSDKTAILVVLLALGLMTSLCCAGICGGIVFFYTRVGVMPKVQAALQKQAAQQAMAPDVVDWIVRSQLSRAYTQALDAVATNKVVIEALGDAIDSDNDPSALFRRTNRGELQAEETFEFDVKGQRGAAVVSVVCAPALIPPSAGMPGMSGGYAPKKMTVTLNDGTQISVPPPMVEPPQ